MGSSKKPAGRSAISLLTEREYRMISGKGSRKLYLLAIILFLMLIAVGFAIKSVDKLEQSMKDPFTMWVDVVLNSDSRDSLPSIYKEYLTQEKTEKYHIEGMRAYAADLWSVIGADGETYQKRGRQVDLNSQVLDEVLKGAKDPTMLKSFLAQCGIIVEADMLRALGYDRLDNVNTLEVAILDRRILVNIVAVVKQLPNESDFMISTGFYNLKNTTGFAGGLFPKASNIQYVQTTSDSMQFVRDRMSLLYPQLDSPESELSHVGVIPWPDGLERNIYKVKFPITGEIPDPDHFIQEISTAHPEGEIEGYIRWQCDMAGNSAQVYSPDWLSIHFNSLENVSRFREDLKNTFGMEISMARVRSAENFSKVTRMTFVIAGMLCVFGLLSAILFINNEFRSHLVNSKENLGTLKAFGLDNIALTKIYTNILGKFLIRSATIAIAAVLFIQLILALLPNPEWSLIDVMNIFAIISLAGVILITMIVTSRTIRKILGKTPGDLIYSRG